MRRWRGNLGCLRKFFTQTAILGLTEFPLTHIPENGTDSLTASAQWKGVHLQKIFSNFVFSLPPLFPYLSFWLGLQGRSLFFISHYLSLQFKVLRWKTNCFHSALSLYHTQLEAVFPEKRLTVIYQVIWSPVDECETSHSDAQYSV